MVCYLFGIKPFTVGFQTVWNLLMTRRIINCHKLCPKPVYIPPVGDSFRQFRTMMIMTHKYDEITGIMIYYYSNTHTLMIIKWLDGSEKKKGNFFQNLIMYCFRQFYCLKPVYDSFGHFGCLKPVYGKTVYTGLYRGIYRPLSETAGPEAITQTDDDSFFIGPSSSAKFKSK